MSQEYNPLDHHNLTKNCVDELMKRGPYQLPPEKFKGCGVYALFYIGDSPLYARVKSPQAEVPIYVGKAVPTGGRKGGASLTPSEETKLYERLKEHAMSIKSAPNLRIEDFVCRYLVVTPLWITMAEKFLIEHYKPIWNVCLEGFGNHDPGSGRLAGKVPWWDLLHPGRPWATKLVQGKDPKVAEKMLSDYFEKIAKSD